MREVSFGKLDILLRKDKRPHIEYLLFEREGRKHIHKEYESFFVISGSGKVISGDVIYEVAEGSLVTIPPNTDHWMIPAEGQVLEGFLWYHAKELVIPK